MKRFTTTLLFIHCLMLVHSSNILAQAKQKRTTDNFGLLVDYMTGTFDSFEQSLNDAEYYNVVLQMHRVWTSNNSGVWLYVEQAIAQNQQMPYRQRMYHLTQDRKGKNFTSTVYELSTPKQFVGQWKNTDLWAKITPKDLILRDGCAIVLKKADKGFVGSTKQQECASNLRGASYATSEVSVTANAISSWDRGFNDAGEQVWGAEKGPYIFKKHNVPTPIYPSARRDTVTDNYFGTVVADPYRWLENENASETAAWIQQENAITRSYLSATGFVIPIADRLNKYWQYEKQSVPFKEGKYFYRYKNDGSKNHSILYRSKTAKGEGQVYLDPNKFSQDGTVSLSGTYFSHNSNYIAYSTSVGGSDWRTFYVAPLNQPYEVIDTLHNIKFSGAAWLGDGFFYSRYDKDKIDDDKRLSQANQHQKLYYHQVGTPQDTDQLVYENKEDARLSFSAYTQQDEQYVFLSQWKGSSQGSALWYAKADQWQKGFSPLIETFDTRTSIIDTDGDSFLARTDYEAPNRRLVRIDPANPQKENWTTVLAEAKSVIRSVSVVNGQIVVHYLRDVSSKVMVFAMDGEYLHDIDMPSIGIMSGFSGKKADTTAYYQFESFMYPPTVFEYNFRKQEASVVSQADIDFPFEDYETKQVFYKSKDGTDIPMFITHKKGMALKGQNPTLLYSYGGFNIARIPEFKIENLPFYESGGVYAVANLRGGSEYGEAWHKAGMLSKKQNVFDDYIAAAEYLIAKQYTNPDKLAATGRSNGGLLMGAVMNQRPELFKVAFPVVGVMDMLRFHKFTIGWAWTGEYGSSDNKEQFDFLYPYSPYHNINGQLNYPATMVLTAERDDRVVPAHSFKYMAELQHQYQGTNPILIRIDANAGHGAGKTTQQRINDFADRWAFLFYHLQMYPVVE